MSWPSHSPPTVPSDSLAVPPVTSGVFRCPDLAVSSGTALGGAPRNPRAEEHAKIAQVPEHNPTGSGCGGAALGEGRICATRGWISVDRGSKATLPLTMPRRVFKSSAKDSARRPFGISLQGGPTACPPRGPWPSTCARGGACAPLLWVGRQSAGAGAASLAWILT